MGIPAEEFAICRRREFGDTSRRLISISRNSPRATPSIITTMFSAKPYLCLVYVLLTAKFVQPVSGQGNFTVNSTDFSCESSGNLICLGGAHVYTGVIPPSFVIGSNSTTNGYTDVPENLIGRLSLLPEEVSLSSSSAGIAYYKDPVRLLDPSTRQAASFNTSFTIDTIMEMYKGPYNRSTGDGLVFVISADSNTLGTASKCFGFFNNSGYTNFKSIVVEYDQFQNPDPPVNDISHNHMSFDFSNISWVVAANASDVDVLLWYNLTIFAWVEYSSETQQLQARISNNNTRPIAPLLNYKVDLFDVVEEFMWVGFASGTGWTFSHYYIGNWIFESYGIPWASKSNANHFGLILGASLGASVTLLLAGCILLVVFVHRSRGRRWHQMVEEDPVVQLEGMPERFSFKQLEVATDSFSCNSKLGQGGFGSVYRGVLPSSGIPVAVKKINNQSVQGEKEFMSELSVISRLRHRNLIQLLGWCKDVARDKYLLVYDLMPNGSLDKVLFAPSEKPMLCLSWKQRFNIISGTAAAVDYLHQGWKQQVIHRDIKSSNIMLDADWNAKLGDFGLARLVDHKRDADTTVVAGTYGYIAPEAAASGRFTDKTDVYAFGAVVLEVACGRKAFVLDVCPEEMVLVDWVWRSLSQGDLLSTVDKQLQDYDTYWMEVVLIVGLLCSHPNPLARPSMRHVVQVLAGDAPVPPIPASKPAPFSSDLPESIWINNLRARKAAGSFRSTSDSLASPNILDSIPDFKPAPFSLEPRSIWMDGLRSPGSARSISQSRSQTISLVSSSNFSSSSRDDFAVNSSSKGYSSNSGSSLSKAHSFNN